MGKIKVNIVNVIENDASLQKILNQVEGIQGSVKSVTNNMDARIIQRKDVGTRVNNISTQLSNIYNRVSKIRKTVNDGVDAYNNTEKLVVEWGDEINRGKNKLYREKSFNAQAFIDAISSQKEKVTSAVEKSISNVGGKDNVFQKSWESVEYYIGEKVKKYMEGIQESDSVIDSLFSYNEWVNDELLDDFDTIKTWAENIIHENSKSEEKPKLLGEKLDSAFDVYGECQFLIGIAENIYEGKKTGDWETQGYETAKDVYEKLAKEGFKKLNKANKYKGVDGTVQSVLVDTIVGMPTKWLDGIKEYIDEGTGTAGSIVAEVIIGAPAEAIFGAAEPVYKGATAILYPGIDAICEKVGYDLSEAYKNVSGSSGLDGVFAAQKELWVDIVYEGAKKKAGEGIDWLYEQTGNAWKNFKSIW